MMRQTKLLRSIRFFSSSGECKPFESIPSPRRWPVVGHLHLFSKLGPYSMLKIVDAWNDLHAKYGPVVYVDIGAKIVLLFNPEDIKELYRNEGRFPNRPLFEVLQHYRRSYPNLYGSGGLVTENGEGWWKLRRAVNWMLRPEYLSHYLSGHEELSNEFVQHVRNIRDKNNEVHDFLMESYKFTLEASAFICFERHFGTLEGKDNSGMFADIHDTLDSMMKTLLGLPFWKIAKTPAYRRLERAQNSLLCRKLNMQKTKWPLRKQASYFWTN